MAAAYNVFIPYGGGSVINVGAIGNAGNIAPGVPGTMISGITANSASDCMAQLELAVPGLATNKMQAAHVWLVSNDTAE